MSRAQTPQPLLSAAPALQPAARPHPLSIGATPPPRRSPLMDLAGAFDGINDELRDMLRDAAATQEKDAAALGEIEATRLRSEGRLKELDAVLKAKVDSGELPAVRLPAAQRAAAVRTGHEAATIGLRDELFSRVKEAVRVGPEESSKMVSELFNKYSNAIPAGAFFERRGFDAAARDVVAQFRERVREEQTVEAERYQKQKQADEGTDLVYQLASAPEDLAPQAKERVKLFLDTIRGEMKKSEVNDFFADGILKGAVARLVEEKNFGAADQILEEVKSIDLTGKGGLFGKTEVGSKVIFELSNLVESKRRTATSADADSMREKLFLADTLGKTEAAKDVYELRKANGGQLPFSERQRLLTEAQQRITDPLAYQSYTAVLNSEFENQERWNADPQATARLLVEVDTLDPKKLEEVEAKLEVGLTSRSLSPSAYHEAMSLVKRNRALTTQISDNDVEAFTKRVFAVKSPLGGVTIDVGSPELADMWETLPSARQTEIRVAAADTFVEAFRQQIRLLSQNNPESVPSIKAQAWDKASEQARTFAASAIKQGEKRQRNSLQKAEVSNQSLTVQTVRVLRGALPSPDYAPAPGISWRKDVDIPLPTIEGRKPKEIKEEARQDGRLPLAERDYVVTVSPKDGTHPYRSSEVRLVHLPALAEAIKANPTGPEASTYAIAKSRAGFTPKEIKAGKTKHGVEFNPGEIDPKVVSVFTTKAELEKHWNNGEPDETFLSVGDLVDPGDTLTTREFYLAQRALLGR